jgi:hypothetical protein
MLISDQSSVGQTAHSAVSLQQSHQEVHGNHLDVVNAHDDSVQPVGSVGDRQVNGPHAAATVTVISSGVPISACNSLVM